MKKINLISAAMSTPQRILIIIVAIAIAAALCMLAYLVYLLVYKPKLKDKLNAAAKALSQNNQPVSTVRERGDEESQNAAVPKNKTENAGRHVSETERLRLELVKQGIQDKDSYIIADMTLEQMLSLKNKPFKGMSAEVIINTITRKVLMDSNPERRQDVEDFIVPQEKTMGFVDQSVKNYIKTLHAVEYKHDNVSKPHVYSINGKSFATFSSTGGLPVKLKIGTYYAQRLTELYPQFFIRLNSSGGAFWFELNTGCSFELIKILIKISYNIAKAGY